MFPDTKQIIYVKVYKANEPIKYSPFAYNFQSDGTSETSSYFAFTASQYDNGQTFSCFAENSVMKMEGVKPMKESTTIEVLCKYSA